ncbi:MAG: beta-lactamase family protein [Acidobacteria bacterium]|nr:beta-lactamase family protein [Acidobacteriota bacterium]
MRFYLLLLPLLLQAGVGDHAEVQAAERLFEGWMNGQMAFRTLPGVAVGVVHDQELIWAKGFGVADVAGKVPVTPATKFRMASHSKVFTATAIMQLRDQGKLRLDDPVVKHLPWFTPKPTEADDPPITIEDLLTHGSGLAREAGSHWSDDHFPDAAGLRDAVMTRSVYSPGVRWKYSNLAFAIAGQIVEKVSGEPFARYMQRHVLGPLGMKDSSFDEEVPGIATGYGRRMPDGSRAVMKFVNARALGPATGLTSTLEDMARFVSLQFRKGPVGGKQILSTAALRDMHRVRLMENNWTRGNAIGFAVNREKDRLYVGHGGSYFGYKTHTVMQLDDKVGVIVLTNGDDSAPSDIAMKVMQGVGAAVAKAASAAKPAVWDPAWARFAGLYRSRFAENQVVEMDRSLVVIDPTGTNFDSPQKLVPVGGGRFRLEGATGGAPVGEMVRFVEENGRVVRMYMGDSFSERVGVQ